MKKATCKILGILALVGGIAIGSICHGLLAYLGGVMFATFGLLTLLGKERILYY